MTGARQDRHDVGQVVLTLGVVGLHPPQRGGEQVASEAVDRRVDLIHRSFVSVGIGVFDHTFDAAVTGSDDPAVAGRIVHHRGEQGGSSTRAAVVVDQRRDVLGSQQRGIAGQDQDVTVVIVVGQPDQSDQRRVAGPALHPLLDEVHRDVAHVLEHGLGHPVALVAHDDRHPRGVGAGERVDHVHQHGSSAQPVQRLGARRLHPAALARGEHHRGERRGRSGGGVDRGLVHGSSGVGRAGGDGWRGRIRTCIFLIQSQAFCR